MIEGIKALFPKHPLADELRAGSHSLLMARMRIGVMLGLVFIPSFIPLDYVRLPEHFAGAVLIRLAGGGMLMVLFLLFGLKALEPWAEWLAALSVTVIGATILAIARFASGASDPIYLVQSMSIIFLITGAALLLPLDGKRIFLVTSIPFVMQTVVTLDYDFAANAPILVSSFTAVVVATVGAQTAFLARLGDYEGRKAKEALLDARSEIVAILTADVEERKRSEATLRKSEQRYRSLFEDTHDGLLLSSLDGRIFEANPAAVSLFGYERSEELLAVRTHELYYHPVEQDRARLTQLLLANDFHLRDVEVDLKRKDGSRVNAIVSSSPVRDENGEVVGYRTILRDVTEKKILEARLRQTQKLEAVGMLAAGVAHEINNPLTYVITHLETLDDDLPRLDSRGGGAPLVESIRRRIREASEGAQRVRQIVRDLRTFARLGEEERAPVDVLKVLDNATKLAASEMRFRARLRQDLRTVPTVVGNEVRLTQVFVNLLLNATQAIEEGAVERNEIRIHVAATETDVVVEIADTGAGIAPENLERLFNPFFTTKSTTGGSGLGLSICYNIVTSFGGRIEVESQLGAGSRFRVHLPIAHATRRDPAPAETAIPVVRHGRVLVIDDEPFVISTVKIVLGRDHEVIGAGSGSEALALLETDDRFDVVLCDLVMQQSSGMDVYAALLTRKPALTRHLVFMTGGAYTAEARRFLANVPNPCLDKPFGAVELTRVVQQAMAGTVSAPRGQSAA